MPVAHSLRSAAIGVSAAHHGERHEAGTLPDIWLKPILAGAHVERSGLPVHVAVSVDLHQSAVPGKRHALHQSAVPGKRHAMISMCVLDDLGSKVQELGLPSGQTGELS